MIYFFLESPSSIVSHKFSPESSLRRTPYASIKKRSHRSHHQQQIYRRNKVLNDSSINNNGNESDYDNNQSMTVSIPVNKSFESDDQNDTHSENQSQQSDIINSTTTTANSLSHKTNIISTINPTPVLEDSTSSNFLPYRKDSLITRRLLDIRSHLLLNTTLDAT